MDVTYFHTYVDIRVSIKANSVIHHQFIVYLGDTKINYHPPQKIKKRILFLLLRYNLVNLRSTSIY